MGLTQGTTRSAAVVDEGAIDAVEQILLSGWLSLGPQAEALERAWAARLGVAHVVATSSETGALLLALLAIDIQPGDEVLVPTLAAPAVAAAVVQARARPVFCDVVSATDLRLDPGDAATRAGTATRALLASHLAGYGARVAALTELGCPVVETGPVAPSGLAAVTGFDTDGLLPGAAGGLLATDDEHTATVARRLRSHGMTAGSWSRFTGRSAGYDAIGLGRNLRLDEPRSTLVLSRIVHLDGELALRRARTRELRAQLAGLPGITLPFTDADVAVAGCLAVPVLIASAERRGRVVAELGRRHGLQPAPMPVPLHELTAYRRRFGPASLPRAEAAARTGLLLPMSWPEGEDVAATIMEVLGR